jgi:hypothetical protein
MHFDRFSFGSLRIDGSTYERDVVLDRGEIRKRKKTRSRKLRDEFGHTPLSICDKIPWKCHRLVIDVLPLLRKQNGFKDEIAFSGPGGTDITAISLWDNKQCRGLQQQYLPRRGKDVGKSNGWNAQGAER